MSFGNFPAPIGIDVNFLILEWNIVPEFFPEGFGGGTTWTPLGINDRDLGHVFSPDIVPETERVIRCSRGIFYFKVTLGSSRIDVGELDHYGDPDKMGLLDLVLGSSYPLAQMRSIGEINECW